MEFIDTHAHLYAKEFDADREKIIQNAIEQHISKVVLPAIDSQSHHELIELAETKADFFVPLMGLHPTSVNKNYKKELAIAEKYLSDKTIFKGVGEIGIDLYWDKNYFGQQKDAFKIQVNWAKQLKLPIVIHTRNSFQETFKLLEPLQDGTLCGIFHCFSGNTKEAQLITKLGFYLGIGGVLTFKNTDLRETLKNIALKHLVLETDSPYLAPVPYRGKRNESAYLIEVAKQLAQVYDLELCEIAEITSTVAKKIFNTNKNNKK